MGTLYIVATPIGNLQDITYRAVSTLQKVDVILCEDTRITKRLLDKYSITTPTAVYHQHSNEKQMSTIIERLQGGENIALVTDAGTPGISDPGTRIIRKAVAENITVTPIPGPSALITTLQAAGVDTHTFTFLGFIPHKKGRQTLLKRISDSDATMIFYESPHRILKTLDALRDCERSIVIGRELTKLHEEFLRGTAEELYNDLSSRDQVRGEFVVIVHN